MLFERIVTALYGKRKIEALISIITAEKKYKATNFLKYTPRRGEGEILMQDN